MTRSFLHTLRRRGMAAWIAFSLAGLSLLAAEKKRFDIPAGTADKALKAFTAQSGSEVVYPAEIARGVKTNAVKGDFTAQEALQRIVAGSDLVIAQDAKTGALTVTRISDPNAARAAQNPSDRPNISSQEMSASVVRLASFEVTGSQLQNLRAADSKRVAPTIADSITSDEVGSLPDFSIAEAASRLPGISYEGRNGDAQFVVIRGMRSDFNYLEIDGGVVPSTQLNRRATQLSIIPSSVIKTTDIVKSFTADMDGNSIGGQLSVHTLSAFDSKKPFLKVSGALGRAGNNQGPANHEQPLRSELTFARRFGKDDTIGVVASATYSLQSYDTWLPGVSSSLYDFINPDRTRYTTIETAAPNAILVPAGLQTYQYNNRVERLGGYAKFEYRPSKRFKLSLAAYQFSENVLELRWDNQLFRNRPTIIPTQLTANSGAVADGRSLNQYFRQGDDNKVTDTTLRAEFAPADDQKLTVLGTYATGKRTNPFYQIRFDNTTANEKLFSYTYENSGKFPVLKVDNPAVWTNAKLFSAAFYTDRVDNNEQTTSQIKADYDIRLDKRMPGFGAKFGVSERYDMRDQDKVFSNDWRPNSATTRALTLNDVLASANGYYPHNLYSGLPQLLIDDQKFFKFFQSTPGQWIDNLNPAVQTVSTDFRVKETIDAAYVMGRYIGYNFKIDAGLRAEKTALTNSGARQLTDNDPNSPLFPIITEKRSYTNFLPSFSGIFNPSENFRIRTAYSRTMGRAEYNNLTVNGNTVVDDANKRITITSGNPGLKPRISDNYDVSLEYYIPANGMLSLGLFQKDIANDIYRRSVRSDVDVNGATYTQTYTRAENAHAAKMRGVEMGVIISSFRFVAPVLSDFGFTGNLSFLDGGFDIEMANGTQRRLYGTLRQPTQLANASLSWTPGKYEVRVAYRHANKSLFSTSATAASLDEYIGPENRIDLQMRYKLTPAFMIFAEGRNLTKKGEDQVLAYGRNHYTREYGMSVWAGVTYRH